MPVGHDISNPELKPAPGQDRAFWKKWLARSGRRFWVMSISDLMDALPEVYNERGEDTAVQTCMQVVDAYREHRAATQPTGFLETLEVVDPIDGLKKQVDVPIMKGETLEPEEWDELIEWAKMQRIEAADRRYRIKQRDGTYKARPGLREGTVDDKALAVLMARLTTKR